MKKELEKQNEAQPKADMIIQMLIACDLTGLNAIFYYRDNVTIESSLSNAWLIHNESVDGDGSLGSDYPLPVFNFSVGSSNLQMKELNATLDNRTIVDSLTINSFSPIDDGNGNNLKIECNGLQYPPNAIFKTVDLYSSSNAWIDGAWGHPGIRLIFFKILDFLNTNNPNMIVSNIGYQIHVGGNPVIGTKGGDITVDNPDRCIGPYNAINYSKNNISGNILVKLRSEIGVDITGVDVVIKKQDDPEPVHSFSNVTITTSYTDFLFDEGILDIDNNCYTVEISKYVAPLPECGSMIINSMESHIGSSYGTPVKFDSGVFSKYFDFIQVDGTKSCLRAKIAGTYFVSGNILFESTNVGERVSGEIYHYKGGVKYDTHVFNNISSGNNYLTSTITCNVGDEIYLYGTSVNSMGGYDVIRSTQVSICPA